MSRTNAKVDPGVNVALAGGVQIIGEGERSNGETSDSGTVAHLEIDVEWAQEFEDESGLAIRLKVPLTIVFTSLDFYYALPAQGETHFGFGAELGALPGIYGVITRYVDDSVFVTFTPRLLYSETRSETAVLINPQVAVGISGGADIVAFASFAHHTGRGFDFDVDLFSDEDNKDYVKDFGLVGIAAEF